MKTFKELLGTDSKKKQVERIEELLIKEGNPEITLQIRYNGISDQVVVDISGGNVPFDVLYRMLELTSRAIRREELNMAAQAASKVEGEKNGK